MSVRRAPQKSLDCFCIVSEVSNCNATCVLAGINASSRPKLGAKYLDDAQKTKAQLEGRCSCMKVKATFSLSVTQSQWQGPVEPANDICVTPGAMKAGAAVEAFEHESIEYVGNPNAVHRGIRSRYTPARWARQQRLSTRQTSERCSGSSGGESDNGYAVVQLTVVVARREPHAKA